jgi:hypothetical protein
MNSFDIPWNRFRGLFLRSVRIFALTCFHKGENYQQDGTCQSDSEALPCEIKIYASTIKQNIGQYATRQSASYTSEHSTGTNKFTSPFEEKIRHPAHTKTNDYPGK